MRRVPPSVLRSMVAVLAVGAITACAPSGPGSTPPAPEGAWLLVPSYDTDQIFVLGTDDALNDLASEGAFDGAGAPCGLAVGPDGRLYVADYNGAQVLVFATDSVTAGGTGAPVATIGSASFVGPCGLSFDAAGRMWVGDYDDAVVYAFADPSGVTGTVTRSPVATVSAGGAAATFDEVYDVLVDADDNLWVVDAGFLTSMVTRFASASTLVGDQSGRTPDLQIGWDDAATPPPGGTYTMSSPRSIAVDADGNVYVGNSDEGYAVRFDGYGTATGIVAPQPDAYLVPPASVAFPFLVALDAEGALWVGDENSVARLSSPSAGTGVVTPSVAATATFSTEVFTNDGGNMRFVPIPPGTMID